MNALLTILHIVVCVTLILTVLLQSGKAGDLAGAFGGAGSQSVFGPRGAASILSKLTTISAVLFMITSMGLWILSSKGTRSVVRGEEATPVETTAVPEKKTEGVEGEEVKPPAEIKQEAQEKTTPPKAEKKK